MDGAVHTSSGSSSEEGGDYDDEPVLKYQRMGADVGKLLSTNEEKNVDGSKAREAIVRMAVHDSYLVRADEIRRLYM